MLRSSLGRWALLGTGALASAMSLSVACGGGDTTPAATALATTSAGSPTQTPTAAAAGDAGPTILTLVAKNTLFDTTELKAKPGEVTINVDNQDDGLPHNVHVYKGSDNTGEDLGKTELESGPVQQTLKLNLTKGEYFFVCEVHPPTMSGKLTVE